MAWIGLISLSFLHTYVLAFSSSSGRSARRVFLAVVSQGDPSEYSSSAPPLLMWKSGPPRRGQTGPFHVERTGGSFRRRRLSEPRRLTLPLLLSSVSRGDPEPSLGVQPHGDAHVRPQPLGHRHEQPGDAADGNDWTAAPARYSKGIARPLRRD